jgi:hypothetical protein
MANLQHAKERDRTETGTDVRSLLLLANVPADPNRQPVAPKLKILTFLL